MRSRIVKHCLRHCCTATYRRMCLAGKFGGGPVVHRCRLLLVYSALSSKVYAFVLSSREVDLTYELDGLSKGQIAIYFETVAKGKLGCVELSGGYKCIFLVF